MIEAIELVKHFRASDGSVVRAVDGVSFTVAAGEMVGLLGANGVGKTTTMRMLTTLLTPTKKVFKNVAKGSESTKALLPTAVISLTLLGVGKYLIGVGDLLE